MEAWLDLLDDNTGMVLAVVVFIATAALAFGVMVALRLHGAVRKRTAGIGREAFAVGGPGSASLRNSTMKVLRDRLVQAGFFDPRGVGFFFLTRTVLAIGLGLAVVAIAPLLPEWTESLFWLMVGLGGLVGYMAPSVVLDRIIAKRRTEYRIGFPDFMDLLVVCADAGLAMEAALERVGRELGPSYPALSTNIHLTNLEIRAGRTLTDALEHFAARLGLEEAKSFATLIQQSAELGSSITDALRVYSEDMRHKRLSRAEEKAYALPAKLSFPLMVCVFPVLFVVILLPVFVRIKLGVY
jgi:tight adherence protein C